jgi:hypothetical protein
MRFLLLVNCLLLNFIFLIVFRFCEGRIRIPAVGRTPAHYTKREKYGRKSSVNQQPETNGMRKSALKNPIRVWPDGIVPYVLDPRLNRRQRGIIFNAMDMLKQVLRQKSCIKFVEQTVEPDGVYFQWTSLDCASQVGRQGGQQKLTLAKRCLSVGTVAHELMHALGFVHEQSRYDRDEFVDIRFENILEAEQSQFDKYSPDYIDHLCLRYDYESIMHYGPYAFSKDEGRLRTVVPKKKYTGIMGQRNRLSDIDAEKLNRLYCSAAKTSLVLLDHSQSQISVKQGTRHVRLWVRVAAYPRYNISVQWTHDYVDVLKGYQTINLKPFDPTFYSLTNRQSYKCEDVYTLQLQRPLLHHSGNYSVTVSSGSETISHVFNLDVTAPLHVDLTLNPEVEERNSSQNSCFHKKPLKSYSVRCLAGGLGRPYNLHLYHKGCAALQSCTWTGLVTGTQTRHLYANRCRLVRGTYTALLECNLTVHGSGTFRCTALSGHSETATAKEYFIPGYIEPMKIDNGGSNGTNWLIPFIALGIGVVILGSLMCAGFIYLRQKVRIFSQNDTPREADSDPSQAHRRNELSLRDSLIDRDHLAKKITMPRTRSITSYSYPPQYEELKKLPSSF